jgi:hypothetical protein
MDNVNVRADNCVCGVLLTLYHRVNLIRHYVRFQILKMVGMKLEQSA